MLLPTTVRYSIRMLIELRKSKSPLTLSEVSKSISVSEGYLKHLATVMGRAGIITCKKGPNGGCRITNEEVTLSDLMQAFKKEMTIAPCLDKKYQCLLYDKCEAKIMWKGVHDNIEEIFNSIKLKDF